MKDTQASNRRPARRNDEMKFANAGPFATLLGKAPKVRPVRDLSGKLLTPQPRYIATSAERYDIGSRIPGSTKFLIRLAFADELRKPKPKRRGRRGGRRVSA